MSATYQEAWGLFHAEQDPKPQFPSQRSTSESSFPLNDADDISQSSSPLLLASPGYPASSTNQPNTLKPEASQASSLDMVKELQRLRQDLHQLQFPWYGESPCSSSSTPNKDGKVLADTFICLESSSDESELPEQVRPSADTLANPSRSDANSGSGDQIQQRPQNAGRFRCWESCCNGRQFSNKSNFIRHQRERRGESCKLRCSFCDAVFSRSSARNAHEASRRCRKQ